MGNIYNQLPIPLDDQKLDPAPYLVPGHVPYPGPGSQYNPHSQPPPPHLHHSGVLYSLPNYTHPQYYQANQYPMSSHGLHPLHQLQHPNTHPVLISAQHLAHHHKQPKDSGLQIPRRGPWLPLEDAKLIELIEQHGPSNWVRIASSLVLRSPKQCRERYHQNLKPSLNHLPITAEEGELIEKLVAKFGKKWAEISRHLNGRSDNSIKNWWNAGANRRNRAVSSSADGHSYTVFTNDGDRPSTQIPSQISSQISSQIQSQIPSQIPSQIQSQIPSQIQSQIPSHLSSQIPSHLSSQIPSQISSHLSSQGLPISSSHSAQPSPSLSRFPDHLDPAKDIRYLSHYSPLPQPPHVANSHSHASGHNSGPPPLLPAPTHQISFNTAIFGYSPDQKHLDHRILHHSRSASVDDADAPRRPSLPNPLLKKSSYSSVNSSTFSATPTSRNPLILSGNAAQPQTLPPLQFPSKRRLLDPGPDGRRHSLANPATLASTPAKHNRSHPNLVSMAMLTISHQNIGSPSVYGLPLTLSSQGLRNNSIGHLELLLLALTNTLSRRSSLVPDFLASPMRDHSRERYAPLLLSSHAPPLPFTAAPAIEEHQSPHLLRQLAKENACPPPPSAPHSPRTKPAEPIESKDTSKISVSSLID